jgi:hypothetical protein
VIETPPNTRLHLTPLSFTGRGECQSDCRLCPEPAQNGRASVLCYNSGEI